MQVHVCPLENKMEHVLGFEFTGRHLPSVLASISLVYNVHIMYDPQTFPEYLNRHDFYTRGMVTWFYDAESEIDSLNV